MPVCVSLILSSYIPLALAANDGGNPDIPNTGDYGNDTPASNTVTIDSDVTNDVVGGYATTGTVENNRITITGGTIGNTVTGGRLDGNGTASGNTVTMSGGTISSEIFGGSVSGTGTATGNTIIMTGGRVEEYVTGGQVSNETASGNQVTISGSAEVGTGIYGGYVVDTGNATGNTVTISGHAAITGYVMGGLAENSSNTDGNASGNTVTVTDHATVGGNIYGGYVWNDGNATGNHVAIAGNATITGDIIGGYAGGTGMATNNTVMLAPDAGTGFVNSTIYGGQSAGGGNAISGNTLDIHSNRITVKNIANFQTVNLHITELPASGNAILVLNDTAGSDLRGMAINTYGDIAGGNRPILSKGDTIHLIANSHGAQTDVLPAGTFYLRIRQGISLDYGFGLQGTATGIDAVLNSTTVDPATGVFVNGRLATVGFLNEGTDFALDTGMTKAMETIRAQGYGAYGAIRGSDIRHDLDKSGDASVSGTHWLLGLAGKLNAAKDYDLIGSVYAEAGWGNIDSDNSFASGHGDTHYYGIGLIGRYQQNEGTMKGAYAQINAKVGRASTDLESNLYDVNGNRGEYDKDATYYGAGIGVGYLWEIAQAYTLDLSARYQWMHLEGYDTSITNDPYKFDDIDSHRTKIGARLNYTENKQYTPYIGVAWEHEFSGTSDGSVYGYSLEDNSLKGDTGVAEIGVTFSPTADSAWKIDANLQGYAGQREGVAGNLAVNYMF